MSIYFTLIVESKHVEAWNKFIVKQKFCASSWLITKINILRCTVSKTSKAGVGSYMRWDVWLKEFYEQHFCLNVSKSYFSAKLTETECVDDT